MTVIIEGKTKVVRRDEVNPGMVVIENKSSITKNDDPEATQTMENKSVYATGTTCDVFQLLKDAGIPVAFERRLTATQFLAPECKMIPLEVIIRRYAVGSYLSRFPNLGKKKDETPHRFHRLMFELFLKTTSGEVKDKDGNLLGNLPCDCLETKRDKVIDDPLINMKAGVWDLCHPKIPAWHKDSYLGTSIGQQHVLPKDVTVKMIEELARKTFLVLEGAWAILGYRLIDFKIEFGIGPNGELLVADVIDNDSWRLRTVDWQELSKQLFRDNVDMKSITDRYALVEKLVRRFSVPKQAIVLWRGSKDDPIPEVPTVAGVEVVDIVISGHKSPTRALARQSDIEASFPQKGVILPLVGMSNGLGPVLAARTTWPTVAVPVTQSQRPHDVWSSLEMPSNVPLMTTLNPKNAVLGALNILAQSNPAAYMFRQYEIEKWDD